MIICLSITIYIQQSQDGWLLEFICLRNKITIFSCLKKTLQNIYVFGNLRVCISSIHMLS